MSKLSGFKKIIIEDVEENLRPLAEKFGNAINPFADEVIKAFDKGITIEDNLNQFVKELTIKVDSSGVPIGEASFKSTLSNVCRGLVVIKCDNITAPTSYPTGTPFISFTENNRLITINNITDLTAASKYNLRILGIG